MSTNNYGNTCFMSFYAAVLTRLSYLDDNKFIQCYNQIIGNVIPDSILTGINDVVTTSSKPGGDLNNLFDDEIAFLNKGTFEIYKNVEGKSRIDYVAMNMPQDVNIITGEMKSGMRTYPVVDPVNVDQNIKYISLASSNYGNVYIVADKRMPNVIQVIFRGTYSSKTAGSYSKPTSLMPLKISNDSKEAYLYGIMKITLDMINTIIQSIRYLAVNFLGHAEPNSVTVMTFGHSLGGAMTTLFSYIWVGLKKSEFYNTSPYNVINDNILCISLGAPRCMNVHASDAFCEYVRNGDIAFKRLVTKGDPVTGVPFKNFFNKGVGFSHPCSSTEMKKQGMRKQVNEDCKDARTGRVSLTPNYAKPISCLNEKKKIWESDSTKSTVGKFKSVLSNTADRFTFYNALSHTVYFYIMYSQAANIPNFFKGMVKQLEVKRTKTGQTVVRVNIGNESELSSSFFILDDVRDIPFDDAAYEKEQEKETNVGFNEMTSIQSDPEESPGEISNDFEAMQHGGGKVSEDANMTREIFDFVINNVVKIPAGTNRNVLIPINGTYVNVKEPMVVSSLQETTLGGKKKYRKTNKRNTRKHNGRKTRKH